MIQRLPLLSGNIIQATDNPPLRHVNQGSIVIPEPKADRTALLDPLKEKLVS